MLRMLLFDLDETLYSAETGLWPVIGDRITLYIQERLGFGLEDARALRARYAREYGVTLTGLRAHHGVDADDYLDYVHRVPIDEYLRPDAALNGMLARLPLPKAILTNADAAHARRVLEALGITRHFSDIVDIRSLEFNHKPQPQAYQRAAARLGVRPAECVFMDDLAHNLAPASALGMVTVLVRAWEAGAALPPGVDYQVGSVLGVERIVAGLLGQV